ncbi:ATP-dependent DNA helicase II subunit 1 [Pleurotus pulmonarius]|nr:ATP-dependent DNA helicase II subunit 1 [Pleurotus pulmonarius]KAF4597068.1 ATP-dependent DNA helicase II subunit 1 [Pleurotus pulmonarius]
MPPYDDWNRIDDEEDDELQDDYLEAKRDVILFCIDCSESMFAQRDDPRYEPGEVKTCHLQTALEAAVEIQKKKVIVGPNDSVGILLFNTTRKTEVKRSDTTEIKRHTYIYQPLEPISAPKIQEVMQLLDAARENPDELREAFPPLTGKKVPMGDVFTSCNWVLRDGAPKTASKRIFLITDDDDPHSGSGSEQLLRSAKTTLEDLVQTGVTVEPFFISTDEQSFDVSKFYSQVLPNGTTDGEEDEESSTLPESISITRIDDLLAQMRFHEVPKRALFSIPFELAPGLKIGVKGYGLVTEQKKGSYKYFVDLGDRMELVNSKTRYIDEGTETEMDKSKIVYGMSVGATIGDDDDDMSAIGTRAVQAGRRPFYTAEEIRSFRTLGLEPTIKLLGFKDRETLLFEDNIKHSNFIYPDELTYAGSKRTFSALIKSMVSKNKIGLVLTLTRRNATPTFCALLPQEEKEDDAGWTDPPGFHLVPLPFADDIRAAPIEEACRASDELKDLAKAWVEKLAVKNGAYPPDSYPNPALAYHNAQLQASAFREEFDAESFEDLTEPKVDVMHRRAGKLLVAWKQALLEDDSASIVPVTTGSKRKADVNVAEAEIRSKWESGTLSKLRVDQLKEFLKSKSLAVSGKKDDLIQRISEWMESH